MGEQHILHSDTTNDSPSLVKSADDDLSSYIGGSLSPSFKAKVMISTADQVEDCDMGMAMEGVEMEVDVASLALFPGTESNSSQHQHASHKTTLVVSTSTFFPAEPLLATTTAAIGTVETELREQQVLPTETIITSTAQQPIGQDGQPTMGVDGGDEAITPALCQDEGTDQENDEGVEEEENEDDNDDCHNDDGHGLDEDPSIISTKDAIYSAVPISSELHIFPHSSNGFNWNQDLFLKPHQRRNLGVDELHSVITASVNANVGGAPPTSSSSSSSSSSNINGGMSAIWVDEIHLTQHDIDQILPSS
ncbi:hypothetical protein BGX23_001670 [Mortierella sp. AD031]|nr:hypothetical protein BGX23_001670 [Mortierella sp. AD031]